MERIIIIAPALLGAGFCLVALAVYASLTLLGRTAPVGSLKSNTVFGPFWAGYVVWLLHPIERTLIAARVSPTLITVLSLVACVAAGAVVGLGHLATGAWLYLIGGILNLLDGRLARAQNRQSQAGALFDSVADRWAELAMFTGFAWLLRETVWLFAVMAATAGSMMVSYTRARGESLGIELRGGAMQRAERIVLVSIGALVAAWLGTTQATVHLIAPTLGIALGICGALSMWTAIGRWIEGYRVLLAKQPPAVDSQAIVARQPQVDQLAVARTATLMPLRISGEHPNVREAS